MQCSYHKNQSWSWCHKVSILLEPLTYTNENNLQLPICMVCRESANSARMLATGDTLYVRTRLSGRQQSGPTNSADRYVVAILKEETIIGHLPRKISKVCSLFLRRDGSIRCKVTGSRRYCSYPPQGGLAIPSSLQFYAF